MVLKNICKNLASSFGLEFKCRGSDNVWVCRYAFGVVLGEMIMRSKPYLAQRKEEKKKQGSIAYMIARDGLRQDSHGLSLSLSLSSRFVRACVWF